jgi:uncharacterized membrane protein YfcA
VLQGAVGAAGPITTSYLLSTKLSRESFLFAINATFFILDWTQFFRLQQLATPLILAGSLAVTALVFAGLGIGFAIQDRIDDKVFRRFVLVMLGCAAVALIARAARG